MGISNRGVSVKNTYTKMYSFKNARFHDEIKKWNTAQLIEVLEINGLGDCCDAIQSREIDGETFLNLTEGKLALWKNKLSMVQIKRLGSYVKLAQEKPQDFIINIPQNNSATTAPPNKLKVEKIKSPIADSLDKLFGQQINPTPSIPQQTEVSESNYPQVKPLLNPSSDFPLKPGTLPPKPANLGRRPPPPPGPPVVNTPEDSRSPNAFQDRSFRPPAPPAVNVSEDWNSRSANGFQERSVRPPAPPVNAPPERPPIPVPQLPSRPSIPSPSTSYSKSPGSSYPKPPSFAPPSIPPFPVQYHHDDEEEAMYEVEPAIETLNLNDAPRIPPANPNSLYQIPPSPVPVLPVVPPSNPIPIRRPAPTPNFIDRPLPTPPKDEELFPLPPNVVPFARNMKSPLPPEIPRELPRPPVFLPPSQIPNFHSDDEEQPEYDVVDEPEITKYRLQPWFKEIDRRQASDILRGKPNGSFIARPSTKSVHECTFTVINDGRIYNLAIGKENGKFILGANTFETVIDIVERFVVNPLVLNGPNNEDIYVTLKRI